MLQDRDLEAVGQLAPHPQVADDRVGRHGVAQLVGGLWFGDGWFARGDGFEVYSTLIGRLSPFGRRDDGRLVVIEDAGHWLHLEQPDLVTAEILLFLGRIED